jgi:hypothetical protein
MIPLQIILSFHNPLRPGIITSRTAGYLLDDLATTGLFVQEHGHGRYKGTDEPCIRLTFSDQSSHEQRQFAQSLILRLAKWAGQESILILRSPLLCDALPTGVQPGKGLMVGYLVDATSLAVSPPMLWRQVAADAVKDDYTFIDGRLYTLTPE